MRPEYLSESGGIGVEDSARGHCDEPQPKQENCGQMAMRRKTIQEMLQERILCLRREIRGLEALQKSLPMQMPGEADAALFDLLLRAK